MTTDITELAQSLKAAADREMICRDGAETSEIWERTVTPENILALVEALEKATQSKTVQREYYEGVIADGSKRIAELESRTVKLPHRNLGHPKLFLLCPFPYYDAEDMEKALAAAGIKVEDE
ncbi:hypothetical protein [Klebsiella pneumoniae]|uniref:hypothetical protein n=1 Tax=Klebsiella pneumoniae TaxID=573 RepID=UPI0003AC7FC4|nr:hypothetical protein [Klebsiella pneumoniae]EXF41003.1 hypothetical protein N035_006235 [Klebsiella pneumoniae EGD-HP19-C]